jgi:molecular chaperone DnaK
VNSPILGIDLGTTNSLVGVFEAGFPGLLADASGHRLLPSAVFWPEEEGAVLVGHAALRQRALHPQSVFTSIKRLMGQRWSEIDPALFPYKVQADAEGAAVVSAGGRFRRPEEISAHVLGALKQQAEAALERPVNRAVITVPAYFHDAQRQATKRAGELAGFTVERILSEPTAAALAYGFGRPEQEALIAVFDFGGGTFDLSVLELNKGVFEVLATCGDTALGGDDIDRSLVHLLRQRLRLSAPDLATAVRLQEAAEKAKITLSTQSETEVLLPFLDQQHGSVVLTRQDLETAAAPTLARLAPLCRQALHDARLQSGDLDAVILVGGSTRMPAVRSLAAEFFGQEPHTSTHPEEAIALGACLQAAILEGHVPGMTLLDVTPLSLGLETFGGLMNVLIPRNTSIPCRAGEMFTNAAEGQTEMRISILQGERELARDNWPLGELTIPFTPAPRGQARVGVQFSLDANGILEVLVRDTATGRDEVLQIEAAIRVDDAKVESMIQSSVDHALEDMNERRFTELQMKADELLAALEAAFLQLGESLDENERTEISALADRTRAALADRDLRTLQETTTALDNLTEPLAARLLEKLLGE